MNGVSVTSKVKSLDHENKTIDLDKDKSDLFVENFAKVSSDENYSPSFKIHRQLTARQTEEFLQKNSNVA